MISRVGQRGKIGLHPFILWGFSACTQTFYGGIRPAYQNIAPLPSSGAKEWHLVVFRRLGEGNKVISFVFLKQLSCIKPLASKTLKLRILRNKSKENGKDISHLKNQNERNPLIERGVRGWRRQRGGGAGGKLMFQTKSEKEKWKGKWKSEKWKWKWKGGAGGKLIFQRKSAFDHTWVEGEGPSRNRDSSRSRFVGREPAPGPRCSPRCPGHRENLTISFC